MQSSTTCNGETTSKLEVPASMTSRDPESAADADADAKMESANNSIAEDMSISTLSVELGEADAKPSSVVTTRADRHEVETSSGPTAAAAVEEASCPIGQPDAGPSAANDNKEDKAEAPGKAASNAGESEKSLPTFPALPSVGEKSGTSSPAEPQSSASSPTKSTADDIATSTSSQDQQPKLETPPSPSIAIAKRPKPGGVASSSKLRAANMPNNPNRGDGNSNSSSTTSTAATTTAAANVTPLRRGKWTKEEEEYAAMVIQMFNAGYLPAPAGTTLRAYLSDKLHCDPMRITKKFTGSSCIGKRVFHPAVRCAENAAAMDSAQEELVSLEKQWRKRLKLKKSSSRRSSSKRESKASTATSSAAASVASLPSTSSTAAATVGHHPNPTTSASPASTSGAGIVSPPAVSPPSEEWSAGSLSCSHGTQQRGSGTISKDSSLLIPQPSAAHHHGASWIDRAHALLAAGNETTNNGPSSENSYSRRKVSDSSHVSHEGTGKEQQHTVMSSSTIAATVTPSEAKDAEALVGFLNSVRAEAASGNAGSGL